MTDIAPAAPAAESAPSAPQASPAPSAQSTPNTQPAGSDTQAPASAAPANDLPPGWSRSEDGKWSWKGLVDGQEVTLDAERASHFLRTKESAQTRWQEAQRLKQEAEAREAQLRETLSGIRTPDGIRQLARELGMKPREVAEAIIAQELEEANLSPDERELRELRARDAEYRQQQEQRAAQEREAQIRQHEQAERTRLMTGFSKSMERVGGVPAHDGAKAWVTSRIAQLYVEHTKSNTPTHIDDLTKRAIGEYRELAAGAFTDDDLVERVWGNETLREKLRARYLEAAKPVHPSKQQPTPGALNLPPRADNGQFVKPRVIVDASPSAFTESLNELVRRKAGG